MDLHGRHTALGDALVAAELFFRMVPRLQMQGFGTLGALLKFHCTEPVDIIAGQREQNWITTQPERLRAVRRGRGPVPGLAPAQVRSGRGGGCAGTGSPVARRPSPFATWLIAALAAWVVPSLAAHACTCAQTPLPELMEEMDFAFVGTANAVFEPKTEGGIISGGDPAGFAFSVELAWKGVVTDTLTVWSPRSGAACGYRFRVGQRYVVLGQNRRGRPTTGMCSGNERMEDALDARYLLPAPSPVVPGATWPAVSRNDLLDILRSRHGKTSPVAASLLAREVAAPRLEGPSLTRLLLTDCEESADILAAEINPSRSTSALTAMAYQLLESDSAEYRAAAIEGLGTLTPGDELVRVSRHVELATPEADECVAAFIASIGAMPAQARWVGVHQLRYFPAQYDRIRPFLEAVADTATEPMLMKTALEVLKGLPSE